MRRRPVVPAAFPPRPASGARRRLVVLSLVIVSLALLSVYFRESSGGALHDLQSAGASALRPFQVAADRVARPFQDAVGWFEDLLDARSESKRLRADNERLRQQLIQNKTAARDNRYLRDLLRFRDGPAFPRNYRYVAVRIIARTPGQFQRQIGIAAGSNSGVAVNDPVLAAEGLVGKVTKVARDTAQVTLLTDETSAVSALDVRTNADGIIRHGSSSDPESLILDRVSKDQRVAVGDVVITAGWRSSRLASLYPRGIPIGIVTSVNQLDVYNYKQIEVAPFADFSSLDSVLVLIPKERGH